MRVPPKTLHVLMCAVNYTVRLALPRGLYIAILGRTGLGACKEGQVPW